MRTGTRLALVGLAICALSAGAAGEKVTIEIEDPTSDGVVRGTDGMGFLAGRVLGEGETLDPIDLMLLLDVSESTSGPSGADIDGDGEIGRRRGEGYRTALGAILPLPITDPSDSILAAEISATRMLLDQLDPRRTRVGVIAFSGDGAPGTPDAQVIARVTDDYAAVGRALDQELATGPRGRTHMKAAISLAVVELDAARSARPEPREQVRQVMLLLSDGRPTLPFESDVSRNQRTTLQAARKAARSGIQIRSYGVGAEGADARYLEELARVAQGTFTPVADPGALRAELARLELSDVADVQIENVANGERARLARTPDGNFFALVRMRPGSNPIQVLARTRSGASSQQRFEVKFVEGEDAAPRDPMRARMRRELFARWRAERDATGTRPETTR